MTLSLLRENKLNQAWKWPSDTGEQINFRMVGVVAPTLLRRNGQIISLLDASKFDQLRQSPVALSLGGVSKMMETADVVHGEPNRKGLGSDLCHNRAILLKLHNTVLPFGKGDKVYKKPVMGGTLKTIQCFLDAALLSKEWKP